MTLEELERAWREQMGPLTGGERPEVLAARIAEKDRSFFQMIARRDFGEVSVALILTFVFAAFGWMQNMWTWYLLAAAMLWVAAFLVVDRYLHGEFSSPENRTFRDTLDTLIARTEHQSRLLNTVWWWYLLPPTLAIGVILAQFARIAYEGGYFVDWVPYFFVGASLFVLTVDGFVFWLNRTACRKLLAPQRDELLALRQRLNQDEGRIEAK